VDSCRRHPDVHYSHVGTARGQLSHQLLAIVRLRDDLEARLPEHAHDASRRSTESRVRRRFVASPNLHMHHDIAVSSGDDNELKVPLLLRR
jgi:hypothetical protein